MLEEKAARIQSLEQRHLPILHYFFRGKPFKVIEVCKDLVLGEKTVRGYISDIYRVLEVPPEVRKKRKEREWVAKEYSEAYEYVFQRDLWEARRVAQRLNQEPEIFVKPPDPVIAEVVDPPPQKQEDRPRPTPPVEEPAFEGFDDPLFEPFPAPPQRRNLNLPCTIIAVVLVVGVLLTVAAVFLIVILPRLTAPNPVAANSQTRTTTSDVAAIATVEGDLPPTISGEILFADMFKWADPQPWDLYGDEVVINNMAYRMLDGYFGMRTGVNQGWEDYTVHTRIIIMGCPQTERESLIAVRQNPSDNESVRAYTWHPCDYEKNTALNVEIEVKGDRILTTENGEVVVDREIPKYDVHQEGGIVFEVTNGSGIDYVIVVESP